MKKLYAHISHAANMVPGLSGRTITCFFSQTPLSTQRVLNEYGAMDTCISGMFNLNRSTTVSLTYSKDEKELHGLMGDLLSSRSFRAALELLASLSSSKISNPMAFSLSLGNFGSTENGGLFLEGTVSLFETTAGS